MDTDRDERGQGGRHSGPSEGSDDSDGREGGIGDGDGSGHGRGDGHGSGNGGGDGDGSGGGGGDGGPCENEDILQRFDISRLEVRMSYGTATTSWGDTISSTLFLLSCERPKPHVKAWHFLTMNRLGCSSKGSTILYTRTPRDAPVSAAKYGLRTNRSRTCTPVRGTPFHAVYHTPRLDNLPAYGER